MIKSEYIVGIDPDVSASGVCFFMRQSMSMELKTLRFPNLIDYLIELKEATENNIIVVVEAGWLHEKSDFRDYKGKGATRISKNVGSNHEVGKLIIEMLNYKGIKTVAKYPLKKTWKGDKGKITHKEIVDVMGNVGIKLPRQTNQETRDATLLAYDHSGLPMRIKSKLI